MKNDTKYRAAGEPVNGSVKLRISEIRLSQYKLSRSEAGIQHSPYSFEKKIIHEIISGHPEVIEELLPHISEYEFGEMAKSNLKTVEYGVVIAVSLLARESILAGVNPLDAYDINDLYLQKISMLNKTEDYYQALIDAAYDFSTMSIQNGYKDSSSMHIENTKQFIMRHINHSFTIEDVADYVGLAPNYLSSLFSAIEKKTIKEYTTEKRLEAAQNMLRFSDYSISEISSYLCFCSQSYFSAVFKEKVGCTPLHYRKCQGNVENTWDGEICLNCNHESK